MKFAKNVSKQPRKKRLAAYKAGLHTLKKKIHAHLSAELKKKFSTRTLPVRNGDTVKVVRGAYKKTSGKITSVSVAESKIFIEKIVRKKQGGKEIPIPIEPSNVIIIETARADKKDKKVKTTAAQSKQSEAKKE